MNKNQGDARRKQLMRRFLVYLAVLAVLIAALTVYRIVRAEDPIANTERIVRDMKHVEDVTFRIGYIKYMVDASNEFIDILQTGKWTPVNRYSKEVKSLSSDNIRAYFSMSNVNRVYFYESGYASIKHGDYTSKQGFYKVSVEIIDGIVEYVHANG